MAESTIDLAKLFQTVTKALSEKKEELNEADSYNKNHGDNMVQIFDTISKAVGSKKKSDAGKAFAYASKALKKTQTSGSAQVYAEGLSRAADTFKSKQVTQENALDLIQSLLGGGAAPAAGGDLLGSLLGGLGGEQSSTKAADDGLDMGDLISAGMAFMQSQQQGGSPVESIIQAVISAGALGGSSHRAKSGELVGNVLMQVLGSLGG